MLVDAEQWPLLTDTGKWGAAGADLGANTEHNGRTYIFFGDVATSRGSGIPINADMVAWIDDQDVLFHGGHLALGWNFILPFQPTSVQGQTGLAILRKMRQPLLGRRPKLQRLLPQGSGHSCRHRPELRHSGRRDRGAGWSTGLALLREMRRPVLERRSRIPRGLSERRRTHFAIGWNFHLPFVPGVYTPTGRPEQPDWRFCGKCGGLFWYGGPHTGICIGAPGGGLRLNAVLADNGLFAPFTGTDPVGMTLSLETPNGAFSYANKVWVFAGFL